MERLEADGLSGGEVVGRRHVRGGEHAGADALGHVERRPAVARLVQCGPAVRAGVTVGVASERARGPVCVGTWGPPPPVRAGGGVRVTVACPLRASEDRLEGIGQQAPAARAGRCGPGLPSAKHMRWRAAGSVCGAGDLQAAARAGMPASRVSVRYSPRSTGPKPQCFG